MVEAGQMNCGQSSVNSEFYISQEFVNVCKEYKEGKFNQEEKDLESYVKEHKKDVLDLKLHLETQFHRQFDVIDVLKMYIAKTKTINQPHELQKETQEIFRECYYLWRDTNLPQDAAIVAMAWAKLHAPGWRDHETHAYIFLADQQQEKYRKILENGIQTTSQEDLHEPVR